MLSSVYAFLIALLVFHACSLTKGDDRSCTTSFGLAGQCVRMAKCLQNDPATLKKSSSPCTIPGKGKIGVCCPVESRPTTTTAKPISGCTEQKLSRPSKKDIAPRSFQPVDNVPGRPLGAADFKQGMKLYMKLPRYAAHGYNPMTTPGMFQGDIMGVDPQRKSNMKKLRKAIKSGSLLWKKAVVPYVISSAFNATERAVIARAVVEMETFTCLRFVPRRQQQDYVFILVGEGSLGRQGGKQVVSLGAECVYLHTVQHELMHAVGIFHEQSRADRDKYIQVVFDNIDEDHCHDFAKYDFNILQHLETPYDLGSLMHYGSYDFSKNATLPTIYVKKGKKLIVREDLGMAFRFSKMDVKKLNHLYRCDERKNVTKPLFPVN